MAAKVDNDFPVSRHPPCHKPDENNHGFQVVNVEMLRTGRRNYYLLRIKWLLLYRAGACRARSVGDKVVPLGARGLKQVQLPLGKVAPPQLSKQWQRCTNVPTVSSRGPPSSSIQVGAAHHR